MTMLKKLLAVLAVSFAFVAFAITPGSATTAAFNSAGTGATAIFGQFGNSDASGHSTFISSDNDACGSSGVNGLVAEISDSSAGALWCLNYSGNTGIAGTANNTSSSRTLKKDIQPLRVDACEVVRQTTIHSYRMKTDKETDPLLVGPIAEELPYPIATWNHKGYNNTQAISISLACIKLEDARIAKIDRHEQADAARIRVLEREVRELAAAVHALHR